MADLLNTKSSSASSKKETPAKRDRRLRNGKTLERNKTPKNPKDPKAHKTPTARSIRRDLLLKEQLELDVNRPGVLQLSFGFGSTAQDLSVNFWATHDTVDNVSYEAARGMSRELAVGGGFGPDALPIKKQEEVLAERLNRHLGAFERQVQRKQQEPFPYLVGDEIQFSAGDTRVLKL